MNGQDVVQVILPWLDEENRQVEAYIVRERTGRLRFREIKDYFVRLLSVFSFR